MSHPVILPSKDSRLNKTYLKMGKTIQLEEPIYIKDLDVEEHTLYEVVVSYESGNPWHYQYLYVGFTDNNKPAGYSKLYSNNSGESGLHNVKVCMATKVCKLKQSIKIDSLLDY